MKSRGGMKVTAYYKSGVSQVFIVPAEIHVTDFRQIAEKVGGEVLRVEFASFNSKPRQYQTEERKL